MHVVHSRISQIAIDGRVGGKAAEACLSRSTSVRRASAGAQELSMSEVSHADIARFAADRVNLAADKAQHHRDQVNRLRDRLEKKIKEDPDYALVKMLHAGSVAKGTALRTVNDLDVAVYVRADAVPKGDANLVRWLADRLFEANPNMERVQFEEQPHCVTVNFRGTGLDVDMVPVLYEGGADDRGYLVNKDTGDRMLTSITLHLRFIRDRKKRYGQCYAELIRLTKWWKRQLVAQNPDFKFKSFMAELIWAHLADRGLDLSDYPSAIEGFYEYILKGEFSELIAFTDFVSSADIPARSNIPIEIFDPVNMENNVASQYTTTDRSRLIEAAQAAFDAVCEARFASTKGRAVDCWQVVFGPSFKV